MAKWRPSKNAAREYAAKMNEIKNFCLANKIETTFAGDSYYFTIDGQEYRVSNHSVEASNSKRYDIFNNELREAYHPEGREKSIIYIHAGKTRIMDIYNNLKAGYKLDGRGNRK